MLSGAYQAEICGSSNEPATLTGRQLESKTSTRSLWKSVAYSRPPASATPRKIDPCPVRSTTTSAFVDHAVGTVAVHARMCPSSHA